MESKIRPCRRARTRAVIVGLSSGATVADDDDDDDECDGCRCGDRERDGEAVRGLCGIFERVAAPFGGGGLRAGVFRLVFAVRPTCTHTPTHTHTHTHTHTNARTSGTAQS